MDVMGVLKFILALVPAVVALIEIVSRRYTGLKRIRLPCRLIGATSLIVFLILHFFFNDSLTKGDLREVLRCEFDQYKRDLVAVAGSTNPSEEELRSLRASAECLQEVAKTSFDTGLVLVGLERFGEALVHLKYARKTAAADSAAICEVCTFIAFAYHRGSNLDGALAYYDSAIYFGPECVNHVVWANRGGVLGALGRFDEALVSLENAIALQPEYAVSWLNYGNVLHELGMLDSAVASFHRAIDLRPGDPILWYSLGNAQDDLGWRSDALRSYTTATVLGPGLVPAWNDRGCALHELGRSKEALESFDRALACDSTYRPAWKNKGIALGRIGRYQESVKCFDRAILIDPQYPDVWFNRSIGLYFLGEHHLALAGLDSCLNYDPKHSVAVRLRDVIGEELRVRDIVIDMFDK
jgi:tetratricopeptide (TPR) repeat protein